MESVAVNQAFLLSNGLLVLYWQVKNALWISLQGKWVSCQNNYMVIYPAGSTRTLSIRIQGLFGRYQRRFAIYPEGSLVAPEPLQESLVTPVSVNILPISSPFLRQRSLIQGWAFTLAIPSTQIIIPVFQIDNNYDKRLLHHP